MSRRSVQLQGAAIGLSLTLTLMSGCAGQGAKTLGALRYEPESEPSPAVTRASHKEVRTEYQELLTMIEDEALKEQIERRIAHVYMLDGEQEQTRLPANNGKSYYLDAIKSYREILEKYPNSPDNAEILYHLSKAYDMEGNQDEALTILRELTSRHPDYRHIAEANFRKADILFNNGAYRESEQAYAAVTAHRGSRFYLNAHYMLGWSHYKQLRFRQALDNFVHVLNQLLVAGTELEALSKPDRSLAEDTLHAISLSLDKLAGAASIQALPALKEQPYVWRVYDNLGQYYLEKELYAASAQSYRECIQQYAGEDITPILHRKMIATYAAGSFPRQALEEKEHFVDAYGIYSAYARQRGGVVESIRDTMRDYLDELARNYHARGQDLQKKITASNKDDKARITPDKLEKLDAEAIAALNKAAYFYQQLIDTFPAHEKLDELIFFRAEALFAARRYQESIVDYEKVAYALPVPSADKPAATKYGADAGYAAIVAYERHLDSLTSADNHWRARAADSMLRFAETYHQDKRSAAVLTNAADYLFGLGHYTRALHIARGLIVNNPQLDVSVKKTAYGIAAHSLFKLERFSEAADDYLAQRQLVAPHSDEYRRITERLASAVYKHAETLIAGDDKPAAVRELLSLKQLSPASPVRITAQYDAATLLISLQQWPGAIAELQDLIQRYPRHQLAVQFPRKLAFAYEKNSNWALAAETYRALGESDPDPALRQEALYLSATMYENHRDHRAAIDQFRHYVHTYPEPFATNMEARYKLAQQYARIHDDQKRLFWLDKLVQGHQQAGDKQTERSRWLAAWANTEYGNYHAAEFDRHPLYPPLEKSLQAKNAPLEKATARYEMAADSGIFEFVTQSAYKMGELYRQFARELRESPRPAELGAREKKLYAEILAEQSRPFDELAMEIHQSNIQRAWDGEFNTWIGQSFTSMQHLNPRRFAKTELIVSYGDEIR